MLRYLNIPIALFKKKRIWRAGPVHHRNDGTPLILSKITPHPHV